MLKLITGVALLTYGLQSVWPNEAIFYAVLLTCLIGAVLLRSTYVSVICLCFILVHILVDTTNLGQYWPAPVVISSVLGALCLGALKKNHWFCKEKPETKWLVFSSLVGLGAIAGVWAWMTLTNVNAEAILFKIDPHLPIWAVAAVIFAFAVFNSFAEEFLFRGPVFELNGVSLHILNLVQAVAFGFYHFKGFPFGLSGTTLAFLFALFQGYLRIRSQNFYYPWISHFIANVGMAILLYQL